MINPALVLALTLMCTVVQTLSVVLPSPKRSWWKGAWRLFRCMIAPLIHHQARINHNKIKRIELKS